MRQWVVGTRKSRLALMQTEGIIGQLTTLYPDISISRHPMVTRGDRVVHVTLSKVGGKGLFVKEIEQALLNGEIDFAVHSMKDVPSEMAKGLTIAAIPKRLSPLDCLVSQKGQRLAEIPSGSIIGTSSLRRQAQILQLRPDLVVRPIRGNIDTRLQKQARGEFDALVLAVAGLTRMGWEGKVTETFSIDQMVPAAGQGALGIQCRAEDIECIQLLQELNHKETACQVEIERSFLRHFGGSCHLPIAACAFPSEKGTCLTALIADPTGKKVLCETVCGDVLDLANQLAQRLRQQGADELLDTVRREDQ